MSRLLSVYEDDQFLIDLDVSELLGSGIDTLLGGPSKPQTAMLPPAPRSRLRSIDVHDLESLQRFGATLAMPPDIEGLLWPHLPRLDANQLWPVSCV